MDTHEKVAIKVVSKEIFIEHPKFESYLRAETKYLPRIKHPNVVRMVEFFEDDFALYFVMEFCDFGDLGKYLKEKMRLPEKEALEYLKQLISAFQILNSHRIMHRDLKLENILLKKENDEIVIKLCDFDFLKKGEVGSTYLGTCLYMAPEILKSNKFYDNKTDLWSLGVVFYKLLYGNYPFKGKTETNLIYNIENAKVKFSEEYEVSEFSVNLMKEIFQVDPEKRISWEKVYEMFDLPPIPLFISDIKNENKEEEKKNQSNGEKAQLLEKKKEVAEVEHYRKASVKKELVSEEKIECKPDGKVEEKRCCFWFKS